MKRGDYGSLDLVGGWISFFNWGDVYIGILFGLF